MANLCYFSTSVWLCLNHVQKDSQGLLRTSFRFGPTSEILEIIQYGGPNAVKTDSQRSRFIARETWFYGLVNEVFVYCDFWRVLSPVIVSYPFINVLSLTAVLSTLPDNPGDSKIWTVCLGLQIRVWYLLDNRQNCYFLYTRLSDHKISNTLRCLSYCGNVFP